MAIQPYSTTNDNAAALKQRSSHASGWVDELDEPRSADAEQRRCVSRQSDIKPSRRPTALSVEVALSNAKAAASGR